MSGDDAETWTDDTPPSGRVGEPDSGAARYVEGEELGRGGLGRVVAVFDRVLDRTLARKELVRRGARDRERFLREARITARLNHPNIPPVHDVGESEDGTPWYTMKVVEGVSLQEALEGSTDLDSRLRYLDRVSDVCRALAYAHSRGIVHRDVKPSNIMLGRYGETWLVDWGLAVQSGVDEELDEGDATDSSTAEPALTRVGAVVGTPSFMSPEQARGEVATEASDQWSLGAVLHTLLVRSPPVSGDDLHEIVARVGTLAMPSVLERDPDLPPELAAIVDRALSFRAEDRYASLDTLAEDLLAWRDGFRVDAYTYPPGEALALWVRTHRIWVGFAVVALWVGASFVATTFAMMWLSNQRIAEEVAEKRVALAEAYTRQARTASTGGDLTAAALYAVEALQIGPSPHARGVLARARAVWAPELDAVWPTPVGCRSLLADEGVLYCVGQGQVAALRDGELVWSTEIGRGGSAVLVDDVLHVLTSKRLLQLDVRTGATLESQELERGTAIAASAGGRVAVADYLVLWVDGERVDAGICKGVPGGIHWVSETELTLVCVRGELVHIDLQSGASEEVAGAGEATFGVLADEGALRLGVRGRVVEHRTDGVEPRVWTGAEGQVVDLTSSPDGQWMAGSTDIGGVHLWPWDRAVQATSLPRQGSLASAAFGSEGTLYTGGERDDHVRVWRFSPPADLPGRHPPGVSQLALSPDRSRALLRLGSGVIRVVDVSTLGTLEEGVPEQRAGFVGFGWVDGAPFTVSSAGDWHWWGRGSGSSAGPLRGMTWLGDDRFARAMPGTQTVEIVRAPQLDEALNSWEAPATILAVEGAGEGVVVLTDDGLLTVLSPQTLEQLFTLEVDLERNTQASLSPSGTHLAIASGFDQLLVIDLTTGEQRTLPDIPSRTSMLMWWSDEILVSGHWDARVRVWDRAAQDSLVAVLEGHEGRVGLAERVDADTLLTAGWDGHVLRWDLGVLEETPESLRRWVRSTSGLLLRPNGPIFEGPPRVGPLDGDIE